MQPLNDEAAADPIDVNDGEVAIARGVGGAVAPLDRGREVGGQGINIGVGKGSNHPIEWLIDESRHVADSGTRVAPSIVTVSGAGVRLPKRPSAPPFGPAVK